jgi:hypothetical protein
LTVTLANVAWPTQLASLDLLVSSPSGALGPELDATNSTATATYNVTSGNVVAQWFGTAQGSLDAGVYAMEIQFQPSSNPVPLPTSIALFLSGIGLLVWQRKSRTRGRDSGLMTLDLCKARRRRNPSSYQEPPPHRGGAIVLQMWAKCMRLQ